MRIDRTQFLGVAFDQLSKDQVAERLSATTNSTPFGYVVTPNVDHVVRLHEDEQLGELYAEAALCLCDSKVLALLARLRGTGLRVLTGSDLTVALLNDVIRAGDTIAVVGGDDAMIEGLRRSYPRVTFAHHSPPMNLRHDRTAQDAASAFIATNRARFTFIAVGSPQQEMIALRTRNLGTATGVGLCIGASLDFVTGQELRAPLFMRRLGLKWAFRLYRNPRRLWRRYLIEGPKVFRLALKWEPSTIDSSARS